MKINFKTEEPLFNFTGCCPEFGQSIILYGNDLCQSKVGDTWVCEDQDCYPNRTEEYEAKVTVMYKDENGILLKFEHDVMDTELTYIEFGK